MGMIARYPVMRTPPWRWSCRKLLRRECEGCQSATLSPGACSSAPRWYPQWMESPLQSGLVGRSPATLKKRIPINNTIRLWDRASAREIAVLKGHEKDVNSVAFSPDGNTIASASADNTIRLWDAVALRDRFPALQARRTRIATAKKNLAADLASAGTDSAALENLKTKVLSDPGLTGDARIATMIVLREKDLENQNRIKNQITLIQGAAKNGNFTKAVTLAASLPIEQFGPPQIWWTLRIGEFDLARRSVSHGHDASLYP